MHYFVHTKAKILFKNAFDSKRIIRSLFFPYYYTLYEPNMNQHVLEIHCTLLKRNKCREIFIT